MRPVKRLTWQSWLASRDMAVEMVRVQSLKTMGLDELEESGLMLKVSKQISSKLHYLLRKEKFISTLKFETLNVSFQ